MNYVNSSFKLQPPNQQHFDGIGLAFALSGTVFTAANFVAIRKEGLKILVYTKWWYYMVYLLQMGREVRKEERKSGNKRAKGKWKK